MYVTTSGATEIDIVLNNPDYLSPWLTIAPNGTVEVDWGDGSAADTMTGTSNTTLKYQQHTYANTGSYIIKLAVISGNFSFYNSSTDYDGVLRAAANATSRVKNRIYSGTIMAIRMGSDAKLENYCFANLINCVRITIPNNVTSIGSNAFFNCYALQN